MLLSRSLFKLSSARSFSTFVESPRPVIVSAVRTPIGSIGGSLSSVTAPQLGSIAIAGALKKAGLDPAKGVGEVIMGNVLSAGMGQAPARQAVLGAGLPVTVNCTTVNKVCASGLKAIVMAAQGVMLRTHNVFVAGGMESMSNVPYYVNCRQAGFRYGDAKLHDGILKDGLWDVYNNFHMGMCAEKCAEQYQFSREAQDEYAIRTYERAVAAAQNGHFAGEIVPVSVSTGRKTPPKDVTEDEELSKFDPKRMVTAKPAFITDPTKGTVTGGNSSKLNDGASALVVAELEYARAEGMKPIAYIHAFADAEQAPVDFTTTPAHAIEIALDRAGMKIDDIDLFEVNEAFSVVPLANMKLLDIPIEKMNVSGGAVAMGHPLGCSGARIVTTLVHSLHRLNKRFGVAAICNGGGGATAIVVEVM